MPLLSREEKRRLLDISAAIVDYAPEREVLPWVSEVVTEVLGLDMALLYGLGSGESSSTLDFCYGPTARMIRDFERFLSRPRTTPWGGYRPDRPEAWQRDAVLTVGDLGDDDVIRKLPVYEDLLARHGLFSSDQMRVLVCDGPALMAWVGGFRAERFTARDRAMLRALVPALKRRLRFERGLRDTELYRAALDVVMDHLGAPAFIVDDKGRISHANASGERVLAEDADMDERLRAAVRGADDGYEVTPLEAGRGGRRFLAIRRAQTADLPARLEQAARRFSLTARQREVLALVAVGDTNKTIAVKLGCSERTVELHVTAILAKVGVGSRAALVAKVLGAA